MKHPYAITAFQMEFAPLHIKSCILDCDISQTELQGALEKEMECKVSRPTINLIINRGYQPKTMGNIRGAIERVLLRNEAVAAWLKERHFSPADLWKELGEELRQVNPAGAGQRVKKGLSQGPSITLGNPDEINHDNQEVEMVNPEALRHFKLFRDPFRNDVQKAGDIHMDDDRHYIEAAMMDAASYSGFLAVVGEVGCGKSTIRKRVIEQLRAAGDVHIVYPEILDKERVGSGSLCDAIIMSISAEKPKIKHEQKARQVRGLLMERTQNNSRCCLVVEEAHRLSVPAFKTLKQLHEMEDATGYKKLLGIILIGQSELGGLLDERYHPEMREVIRRCQVARIHGLQSIGKYVEKKLSAVGGKIENIIDAAALDLLGKRLVATDDQNRTFSTAYPLTVNHYIARAMNLAFEMGETKVTADVVTAI
ncbi:MAG: AAA family ATPase [Desulfuromonadales bacterium]|nr:AAA family ATPase [Desulfuromonadales bacterium]